MDNAQCHELTRIGAFPLKDEHNVYFRDPNITVHNMCEHIHDQNTTEFLPVPCSTNVAPDLVPPVMSVWADFVVANAWITMAFAVPLSAADARGMCAEHVPGVFSSLWGV